MAAAHRAGVAPSEFWGLTPHQLNVILRADGEERKHAFEMRAWSAWHVAYLPRTKRPIPIQKLMGKPRKSMNEEELRSFLRGVKAKQEAMRGE